MSCEELQELITGLVDGELSEPERTSVESHLRACSRCRFAYEREKALKRQIRSAGATIAAPAYLRERILRDARIAGEGESPRLARLRLLLRPAFVFALLVLMVLPTIYFLSPASPPIGLLALETYERVSQGEIPFARGASEKEVKEFLTQSVKGRFSPMGYDLSAMRLVAVGGFVREARGRKILVTVYEGEGPSLICYTFPGTKADAPPEARVFFYPQKKITFYTFSRGELSAVFYRAGNLICILVSKMPTDDLLALAISKAKPAHVSGA